MVSLLLRDVSCLTVRCTCVFLRKLTLYRWLALTVGRNITLRKSDITCPYPQEQHVLVSLCRLAVMVEDVVISIYSRKTETLWQLYEIAQKLLFRLREYGDELGLGTTSITHPMLPSKAMALLTLHNSE